MGDSAAVGRTWSQFEAIVENITSAEHVQAKPCARESDYETPHVSQVSHCFRPHEGKQNNIILLALESIDRRHPSWHSEDGCPCTSLPQDIANEVFLPIVGRQD
jgi:hypothetical protein